jgi:hypothetical protein
MAIISHIQGALGNQMFQYAVGLALSKHYNSNIRLDNSWFNSTPADSTPRQFELPFLQIPEISTITTTSTLAQGRLGRLLQRLNPMGPHILRERKGFVFDEALLNHQCKLGHDIHLIGYWQSYRYIQEIQDELKLTFRTKSPLSTHYQKYLKEIISSNSTMIHIRRGDYVSLQSANLFHKALDISYYLLGINEIHKVNPETHFFIFSDDLDWAKSVIPKYLKVTYIEHEGTKEATAQELQLMTYCTNHIIANSSLSWWGAWLKKEEQGYVFAPNRWIRDASLNLDDLLPQSWKRLNAE